MFVVHTSNCHGQNCTRWAIHRLGIDTLIANILVYFCPSYCHVTLKLAVIRSRPSIPICVLLLIEEREVSNKDIYIMKYTYLLQISYSRYL